MKNKSKFTMQISNSISKIQHQSTIMKILDNVYFQYN